MTMTSVKDVGIVTSALTSSALNAGNTQGASFGAGFQNVWNNRTGRNASPEKAQEQVSGTGNHGSAKEIMKARETLRKPLREEDSTTEQGAELTEEQTQRALEVLGTAVNELLIQVADTFDMSVEEVQQLMDEMGMSPMDMLNPEHLSALLLKTAGMEDSVALLTNGELYTDFMQLLKRQQELLGQAADELGMTEGQLAELLEEMEAAQVQENDAPLPLLQENLQETTEPVTEITVEEPEEGLQVTEDLPETAEYVGRTQTVQEKQTVEEGESRAKSEGGKEQHNGNGSEQPGNLFLQNLKNEVLQPEVSNVQPETVWDADTQQIMRQIMDYLKIQVKPEMSELEMQLHPASLGSLQIHVSSKGGVLTANFVTQNETVKAALESQMIQLKESFAQQGVRVESIEVTVQTHQFERALDQGRGSSSGEETPKRNRPRRMNLNAVSGLGEMDDFTQEEKIAADMMAANGNTVDYTA